MRWTFLLALFACSCGNTGASAVDGGIDIGTVIPLADLSVLDLTPLPIEDLVMLPDLRPPPPTGADYAMCMMPYLDLTGMQTATIMFGFINGKHQYAPYCATVQIGEPVVWQGTFNETLVDDPLVMASSNTTKVTPMQTAPDSATVTFVKPGFYGYYSKANGKDDGTGMAGLIQVVQ
jgi:plastocyanin